LLHDPLGYSRRDLLDSGSHLLFTHTQFVCITVLVFDGPLMWARSEREEQSNRFVLECSPVGIGFGRFVHANGVYQ
jgi:hypothetical protein